MGEDGEVESTAMGEGAAIREGSSSSVKKQVDKEKVKAQSETKAERRTFNLEEEAAAEEDGGGGEEEQEIEGPLPDAKRAAAAAATAAAAAAAAATTTTITTAAATAASMNEAVDDDDDDVVFISERGSSREIPREKKKGYAEKVRKDDLLLTLGWGNSNSSSCAKTKNCYNDAAAAASRMCGGGAQAQSISMPEISLSLGSSVPSRSMRSVSNRSEDLTMTTTLQTNSRSLVHNPSCSLAAQRASLDELNSSASQYAISDPVGNDHSVYKGGIFKRVSFQEQQQQLVGAASPPKTVANAVPTATVITDSKWSSPSLERYHALFPDLKEGFRAKYAGARRSRNKSSSSAPDEIVVGRQRGADRRIGLYDIAADPVPGVAHKLQELPDIFLEDLKRSLTEMLGSVQKRDEFLMLQRILQRRNDLSAEMLFLAHRVQLEIMVALRTGIQAFLLQDNPLSTAALVEVFLQKRCRNISCQNQLPADDCDCQTCSSKEGFCNACMCVACSKFDFMANTCRWVGCDFCLHWCHTDCGIRLSYIKPGAVQGKLNHSEMQFLCVSCGHASDLFGFVKEVFATYAREWSLETMRQELDCIQRIFRRSQDSRGKQLCWIAEQMLRKTEGCVDTSAICDTMIQFFTEGSLELPGGSAAAAAAAASALPAGAAAAKEAVRNGYGDMSVNVNMSGSRHGMNNSNSNNNNAAAMMGSMSGQRSNGVVVLSGSGNRNGMMLMSSSSAGGSESHHHHHHHHRNGSISAMSNNIHLNNNNNNNSNGHLNNNSNNHLNSINHNSSHLNNSSSNNHNHSLSSNEASEGGGGGGSVEGLIQLKQAEARMFQQRAEEARMQAEALGKILAAKTEKLEEEHAAKRHKLGMEAAMEKRKRCAMEVQMLEKGLSGFNSMKHKLVSEVQDVLRRMEGVKRKRMISSS